MVEAIAGIILVALGLFAPVIFEKRSENLTRKYARIYTNSQITAAEAARTILHSQGIDEINVISVKKINNSKLNAIYNPKLQVIQLPEFIYKSCSISAISMAAHECGHALQDKNPRQKWQMKIASLGVLPIMLWIPWPVAWQLQIHWLMSIGYISLAFATIVGIVISAFNINIELDASNKGIALLEQQSFLPKSESRIKEILNAAASTYVVKLITHVLVPIGLVLINNYFLNKK